MLTAVGSGTAQPLKYFAPPCAECGLIIYAFDAYRQVVRDGMVGGIHGACERDDPLPQYCFCGALCRRSTEWESGIITNDGVCPACGLFVTNQKYWREDNRRYVMTPLLNRPPGIGPRWRRPIFDSGRFIRWVEAPE